jgi:CPA2 family monovalent cation:H+ antiporter-2
MMPLLLLILGVLLIGGFAAWLRLPGVVGFLLAGIALGGSGLGIIESAELVDRLGAIGVLMLLFFVGMETSPQRMASEWRVAVLGVLIQVTLSVACTFVIGFFFDWPFGRSLLLGFVISMSSTAVVVSYLQSNGTIHTAAGQRALFLTVSQDLAVVPMLIALNAFNPNVALSAESISLQVLGAIALLAVFGWMAAGKAVHLPLGQTLRKNHDLQLFAALLICFGAAFLSGIVGLSSALGAFIGGMYVGVARETDWIQHRLDSLKIIFVALFFISVGMALDLQFLRENWLTIAALLIPIFFLNTIINTLVFRSLGEGWKASAHSGALLAQIGEFAYVLAAMGLSGLLISAHGYQLVVAVISVSLVLSPFWVKLVTFATQRLD